MREPSCDPVDGGKVLRPEGSAIAARCSFEPRARPVARLLCSHGGTAVFADGLMSCIVHLCPYNRKPL